MILKLYALVSDDRLRLYELDANSLRVGYALANDKPATIHWGYVDAEKLRQKMIDQSGSTTLTVERIQVDALAKLVQWDIDTGVATEITDLKIPKENQDDT